VWSTNEVIVNIKVNSRNNNNNKLKSNLEIKCKNKNHKQKIDREECWVTRGSQGDRPHRG